MTALLELLVFTSLWVAAVAAALCAAAGRALGAPADPPLWALAAAGTFVVYSIDRLRDTARDRATSPRRTAFVERWRPALLALCGVALLLAAGLTAQRPATLAVLVPVAGLGLFHRRLKRWVWWKPFYVSGAWTAVCVGLPALSLERPRQLPWVAGLVGATVLANVIASNLRDDEAPTARFGPRVPLALARGIAAVALLAALWAPAASRPLAMLPLATLAALLPFRPAELYGGIVVDGALGIGALAALALY